MDNRYNLTFMEIMNKPNGSRFIAESFREGVCVELANDGVLLMKTYSHENDVMPEIVESFISKGMVNKKYKEVFTRQATFKNK